MKMYTSFNLGRKGCTCNPRKVSVSPSVWLESSLHSLLKATIQREHITAIRDAEILAIQRKHQPALDREEKVIATLPPEIEAFAVANREKLGLDGKKSVQLSSGMIGFRAAANPALVLASEKWTWEKVARKLKTAYKARFFHAPKPPAPDKTKLKKELTEAQLAAVGLKLERTDHFFYELNRLEPADTKAA